MTGRWLVASLVAALGACASGGQDSSLVLAWKIETLGAGPSSCAEAGATLVELETREVAGAAAAAATATTSAVPCANGTILVHVPAPTDVAVTVRLRDERGRVLAELVFPRAARAEGGTVVELGTVIFQVLTWHFSWSLASGTVPIDCASGGATTVTLAATPMNDARAPAAAADTFTFPCAAGEARTTAVLPGRYELGFRLLAADGRELAAVTRSAELKPDVPPELAPVVFTLGAPL